MEYDLHQPWKTLDLWQKEILAIENKDICIVSGRQCGKTTVVSLLAARAALRKPNQFILIGSGILDQAHHLFRKIKDYVFEKHEKQVVGRTTLNFMQFKNGSKILCVPIGDTGDSMRGYTANLIIIDEAAIVPDRAWDAIEPVISVAKGKVILLSTPQGKKGFFWKAFKNPDFFTKQISARDCPRHTKEFLDRKQAEKSAVAFATEYLGEFIDDYSRKFTDEWIEKVCTLEKPENPSKLNSFLGIDVAGGVGKGETTFEGFSAQDKLIIQTEHIFSDKIAGPEIHRQITALKSKFNYDRNSIGFDSRGEGSGTFKYMMEDDNLKRCLVSLDNATRPAGRDGKTTKLLKEFMYDLVEEAGWRGELKCFNAGSIKQSFTSIQVEFTSKGERRYWGTYDHIVEGIIRGVWLAKNKSLNIYIY